MAIIKSTEKSSLSLPKSSMESPGKEKDQGFPRPLTNADPEKITYQNAGDKKPAIEDLIQLQNAKFDTVVSMVQDLSAKLDAVIKIIGAENELVISGVAPKIEIIVPKPL